MSLFLQKLSRAKSLLTGLFITGRNFISRDVTVYYPRQTVADKDITTYRGHIELVGLDGEPETPRCISCLLCAQACPSGCITVAKPKSLPKKAVEEGDGATEPASKQPASKCPSKWEHDYTLCSLCGSCVEVCPAAAIRFSNNIYLAGTSSDNFRIDLLRRLQRKAREAAAEQGVPSGGKP